jgi:UDP:flavonoid glycosyltransferase YjiC (YdhE family)
VGPVTAPPAVVLAPGSAKVVAVSQGTVDNSDPTKLIVSTVEALKDGPYVVVATTAGVQTAQLRKRYAAPNVVIEDFINYDDLFPHVDVFVSNGGFGSVLAAMRHGVPVVGAGKREGKNDINARVGYNRLGIDLRNERPRPVAIRGAVRRVLDDPAYAANAEALRAELASYDPMARIEAALLGLHTGATP